MAGIAFLQLLSRKSILTETKIAVLCSICLMGLLWLAGCGGPSSNSFDHSAGETVEITMDELAYDHSMQLEYATNFAVDYYEDGYKLLKTKDGTKLLIVPEGKPKPKNVETQVIVLQAPVCNIYLVASAVMDMFCSLDALDTIRLSGLKEEGWYIEEAKTAMQKGEIIYAGKYNQPDYELIVSEQCSLAIENMMISHAPEVVEMLENFGIPVVTECSSYESHPLGRVEWIKFFGALTDKEEEANRIFAEQTEILNKVMADEKTNQTVAFFSITSNGLVQVRQSADYIPKMIALAGGNYVFENLGDPDVPRSIVNIQIEEFYHKAKDADYLIYNSAIAGEVTSIQDLLDKCEVLKDFKAIQTGNVWCTTNDMYQKSMSIGGLLDEFHRMLMGETGEMRHLFPIK